VILYSLYTNKQAKKEQLDEYYSIKKYLLNTKTLGKSKKPILWIHVPYEYNSRNWQSFGSRSSYELNQPYLYLTVRSIIKHCDDSFTICIIDDSSFKNLLDGWSINMNKISDPVLSKMRLLGLTKLLYFYGGMICPISFLCFKDLISLYKKGTHGNTKMFVCETVDRNITSTDLDFYPNIKFCGCPRKLPLIKEMIQFIQQTVSYDYTADSEFTGIFDKWINHKIHNREITMIDGIEIGTKTTEDKQIVIDDLISNYYLDLHHNAYGILICAHDILKRTKFEWFAKLSQKEVLESNTIIGNYILIAISPGKKMLEPLKSNINERANKEFVGFWRTPLQAIYGLKPIMVSDNAIKIKYPPQ
jgi:hypothetical protein